MGVYIYAEGFLLLEACKNLVEDERKKERKINQKLRKFEQKLSKGDDGSEERHSSDSGIESGDSWQPLRPWGLLEVWGLRSEVWMLDYRRWPSIPQFCSESYSFSHCLMTLTHDNCYVFFSDWIQSSRSQLHKICKSSTDGVNNTGKCLPHSSRLLLC